MKPVVSDTILRDAVIKELEDDPEVIAKHIWVTAIDGAVTLAGHVMTIHEKHVAVRAAERVEVVRAVADAIEVRAPSLHERADDEIAEEIAHLRNWRAELPTRSRPKSVTDASSSMERSSRHPNETPPRAQSVSSQACASSTT
jgi:hypothetical protein